MKFFKKKKSSIFIKLLLILLISGFLINIFVGLFFKNFFAAPVRQAFQRNIDKYFEYIIKDIGSPPNYQRAKNISKELLLDIYIQSKTMKWASRGDFPNLKKMKRHSYKNTVHMGWRHGKFMLAYKKNKFKYIFVSNFHQYFKGREKAVFVLIIALSVILITAYFTIRWILKPIKLLTEGVLEVSHGNLNHKIHVKRKDELGYLSESFNTMTGQIHLMVQAQRQLLLDVSHELRSPITRMRVGLELIENSKIKNGIQDDLIEMEQMIGEILESERLGNNYGSLKIEETDLVKLIKDVLKNYENKKPVIILHKAPLKMMIKLDIERIKIVLKNVLENALKYSKISDKNIEVDFGFFDNQTVISVTDYGDGIPQKDIPLLFEPFYRVDASRSKETGGYGLGLHLCKKIMQAHGGEIFVNSNLGEGTKVRIIFPKQKASTN